MWLPSERAATSDTSTITLVPEAVFTTTGSVPLYTDSCSVRVSPTATAAPRGSASNASGEAPPASTPAPCHAEDATRLMPNHPPASPPAPAAERMRGASPVERYFHSPSRRAFSYSKNNARARTPNSPESLASRRPFALFVAPLMETTLLAEPYTLTSATQATPTPPVSFTFGSVTSTLPPKYTSLRLKSNPSDAVALNPASSVNEKVTGTTTTTACHSCVPLAFMPNDILPFTDDTWPLPLMVPSA